MLHTLHRQNNLLTSSREDERHFGGLYIYQHEMPLLPLQQPPSADLLSWKKYSTGELGKEEMEIVHVSGMDIQLKDINLSSNSFITSFSSSTFNSICLHLSTKCGNEISNSSHSFSSFPPLSFLLDYHSALSHTGSSSLRSSRSRKRSFVPGWITLSLWQQPRRSNKVVEDVV